MADGKTFRAGERQMGFEVARRYIVTSKNGMTPFSTPADLSAAIADSVRARRLGLNGVIIGDAIDATPEDCDRAAQLLGWDRDPASADMDRPVNANTVAADLAGGAR